MSDPVDGSCVLAILLGAANWPGWPELNNEVFEDSYKAFRAYLGESLHLTHAEILDLFGSEDSPNTLVDKIEKFLSDAVMTDVATDLIVYYVGHGDTIGLGGEYAILTACAKKNQANSSTFRASYLFDATRIAGRRLRTYFVLDACFSAAAVAAFSQPIGSRGMAILASASSGDKSSAPVGAPATVFTESLLAVLKRGEPERAKKLSLRNLKDLVRDEILARGDDRAVLPELHSPQQRREDVADVGLFPNPAYRYHSAAATDLETKPWCAVVSEADASAAIAGNFRDTLAGFIDRYRGRLERENGWRLRNEPTIVAAADTFRNPRAFQEAVSAVCAADLAFFDLTGLEPAVLVLLGIRAVIRRGVTICSTAEDCDFRVSEMPPFLLRDINMISHGRGIDVPEQVFGTRAIAGIRQISLSPHGYSDLPAFDALRELPLDPGERTILPYHASVLVLCPFSQTYTENNWNHVRRLLPGAIAKRVTMDGFSREVTNEVRVERTLDMGSPQVVSVNLLKAMRLNDLCICDLTEWKPNVLFELGLRLASRPLHPLCILDAQAGGMNQQESEEATAGKRLMERIRGQCHGLQEVLGVLEYQPSRREDYYKMIEYHLAMREALSESDRTWSSDKLPIGGIYRIAWQYADRKNEPSGMEVLDLLRFSASELQTKSRGSTPFIFPVAHALTESARKNSIERLIAAWLYLKHRKGIMLARGEGKEDFLQVGYQLAELLADSPSMEDQMLSMEVFNDLQTVEQAGESDES
jgi:Caspase domain